MSKQVNCVNIEPEILHRTCTCDAGGFKMASCQILTASCYGVRAVHSVQQENGVINRCSHSTYYSLSERTE